MYWVSMTLPCAEVSDGTARYKLFGIKDRSGPAAVVVVSGKRGRGGGTLSVLLTPGIVAVEGGLCGCRTLERRAVRMAMVAIRPARVRWYRWVPVTL